jgi:hypothetical protein
VLATSNVDRTARSTVTLLCMLAGFRVQILVAVQDFRRFDHPTLTPDLASLNMRFAVGVYGTCKAFL